MTNPQARVRTLLAAFVGGFALLAASACTDRQQPAAGGADAAAQVARLQRLNDLLQRQVELAGGKDFYLVLDPAASDLTLMLSGAELQSFRVIGLQVGTPRVSWFSRGEGKPWRDVVWSRGQLDPPREIDRLVVQAPPPGKETAEEEAPVVPPTPEEMYPVPSRYQVRFEEGRSIEVRPLDADKQASRLARFGAWWVAKWHDVAAAIAGRDRDTVRLRVVLDPKDAASLYRSLPPAVKLIILPTDRPIESAPKKPAGAAK